MILPFDDAAVSSLTRVRLLPCFLRALHLEQDGGESAQHEIGMWFTEVSRGKKTPATVFGVILQGCEGLLGMRLRPCMIMSTPPTFPLLFCFPPFFPFCSFSPPFFPLVPFFPFLPSFFPFHPFFLSSFISICFFFFLLFLFSFCSFFPFFSPLFFSSFYPFSPHFPLFSPSRL